MGTISGRAVHEYYGCVPFPGVPGLGNEGGTFGNGTHSYPLPTHTDRPIVAYCIHSAHRAPEAVKTLRKLSFTNAYVLEGGIVAWQAGGLTIRAADLAKEPTILPYSDRCATGKKQG